MRVSSQCPFNNSPKMLLTSAKMTLLPYTTK